MIVKPCPFCEFPGVMDANKVVTCRRCAISLPVQRWNDRPVEERYRIKIEELASLNDRRMSMMIEMVA